MIRQKKEKTCCICGGVFKLYRTTDKTCSITCEKKRLSNKPKANKIYTIPKKSEKRKKEEAIYLKKKPDFLSKPENKKCPVFPNLSTTDVHHKRGRIGYADEWARLNNISLYLDERYWLAVSRQGHRKIEDNPEWAKSKGFSLNRI